MASGTIPAGRVKRFLIAKSKTLTIRPANNQTHFALVIYAAGARAVLSGLYYISGYSLNSTYHVINAVVSASNVSVTTSSGDIVLQNNHSNDDLNVVVDEVWVDASLSYTVSS